MNALILAGGFGKRLQSVVHDVPKPMAPVAGKPFLAHLLDYLSEHGFTEVTLSLHYLPEKISAYFGAHYRNISIQYVIEDTPLGTGGAILYALNSIRSTHSPLFILNGDTFVQVNYRAMYQQHIKRQRFMTMAVTEVDDCSRYGEVLLAGEQLVNFQAAGAARRGFINAGVYLLSTDGLETFTLPKQFSFEQDFLYQPAVLSQMDYFMTDDFFIDIGIPEDYHRFCGEMLIT
jgi:D-glycero-alpha-D-manno-heptose 1-phosphate guanylyltransferase